MSKRYKLYTKHEAFLWVVGGQDIVFKGSGVIDGQGYMWWMREYLQKNIHGRPYLVVLENCTDVEWTGIKLMNSPTFHLKTLQM